MTELVSERMRVKETATTKETSLLLSLPWNWLVNIPYPGMTVADNGDNTGEAHRQRLEKTKSIHYSYINFIQ